MSFPTLFLLSYTGGSVSSIPKFDDDDDDDLIGVCVPPPPPPPPPPAPDDALMSKFLFMVSNHDLYFCFGQWIKSFTFGAVRVVSK